jgi:hypothetical protein
MADDTTTTVTASTTGATDGTATTTTATDFKAPASQADLDRIISDRLARERARFADYDDLKSKASQYDALAEASKTEQERAVETARTEATQAEREKSNGRLVASEARALAAEAKFRNPALAVKAIELDGIKVNDDGTVDADAVKARLKALSDADPYLLDDGKAHIRTDKSQGGGGAADTKTSVAAGRDLYEQRHPKRTTASA